MTVLPIRSAGYLPEDLARQQASDGLAEVEIVDLSQADPGLAGRLVGAIRLTGFIVVTGHGVDGVLLEDMAVSSAEFFALPLAEKLGVGFPAPEVIRGYEPLPPSEEVRSSNAMECLLINRLDDPGDYAEGSPHARLWRWPNLWPDRPAGLRTIWESYYQAMDELGLRLLALIAEGLGLPEQWFADKFTRHFNNLAANHYPPHPEVSGSAPAMRNRAHTDHGALTLLYRPAEPGGLEVYAGGAWRQVPFLPGSLVINVGDILERWTAGILPATAHRVVGAIATTGTVGASGMAEAPHRYSIAYFQQPNPDAIIEPAPGLATAGTKTYPPVRAGAHISGKELGSGTLTALGI